MFYTKYNLPKRVVRFYEPGDKVDRLSYCDSTTQIQRFIQAGENLRNNRFNAMYHPDEALNDNEPIQADVYNSDPVETELKITELKEVLGSRISEKIRRSAKKTKKNDSVIEDDVAVLTDSDNAT